MVLWYYDSENRRQGPINPAQFRALVARGIIVPDTIMEAEGGKRGKASQIPGVVFPANAAPPPIPPRAEPVQDQTDQVSNAFPGPYPGDAPLNYPGPDQPPQGGTGARGEDAFSNIPASDTGMGRTTEVPADTPQTGYRPAKALPADEIRYITDRETWKKNGGLWGWLTDVRFSRIGIQYRLRLIIQTFYLLGEIILGIAGFVAIARVAIQGFRVWLYAHVVPWFLWRVFLTTFFLVILVFLLYTVVARLLYEFSILLLDYLVTTTQAARKYLNTHHQEP